MIDWTAVSAVAAVVGLVLGAAAAVVTGVAKFRIDLRDVHDKLLAVLSNHETRITVLEDHDKRKP